MADDQGSKIASIDELVNELTKKSSGNPPRPGGNPPVPRPAPASISPQNPSGGGSVVPGPSAAPKTEIPKPRFTPPQPLPPNSTIRPPMPPSPSSTAPKPPVSPAPAKSAQQTQTLPQVKEYQSSFRTMKEDILTLKQGQKPAGVDVPRKVEAPAQVAPQSPKPTLPSGGQPSQGFKMPTVNLGQAEKTGPLPQEKRFTSSVPTPPTPVAPPVLEPKKSQIYVPPTASSGISGGGNSRLFMLIAGIAVIFGIFYWFLVLREPTVEMV